MKLLYVDENTTTTVAEVTTNQSLTVEQVLNIAGVTIADVADKLGCNVDEVDYNALRVSYDETDTATKLEQQFDNFIKKHSRDHGDNIEHNLLDNMIYKYGLDSLKSELIDYWADNGIDCDVITPYDFLLSYYKNGNYILVAEAYDDEDEAYLDGYYWHDETGLWIDGDLLI